MTIQHQHGQPAGSIAVASAEGTITAREGATRQDLYRDVYNHVREQAGVEGHVSVLLFSLDRNDLEG
jgi:hypothetical protein